MPALPDEALRKKQQLRRIVSERRAALREGDLLSRQIWEKMPALPQFSHAGTVMTYLDFGNEVRTRDYVPKLWQMGKTVVVPYCVGDELRLFCLKSMDELSPGTWQILEPKPEWRECSDRRMEAGQIDFIIVPGVAFDRNGCRLGQGKGYYDRFLRHVRSDAVKIALAFECQLVEEIPVLPHDVRMDKVITENGIYGV